jgi:ParB family chromosome partitioning protein
MAQAVPPKNKKKGLGRGLEVLLGDSARIIESDEFSLQVGQPITLRLEQIQPGQHQPRTQMDTHALQELANSIRVRGLLQPILVRALQGGLYEIIAGERRFRAARLAGLEQVPALVREASDQAVAAMALIENIQREDLNPLEEAKGIQRLLKEFDFTHQRAAQAIGRSRSAVSNLLRLLNLAKPVQAMISDNTLSMGHARALLAVDIPTQMALAKRVAKRQLSVRDTERLVNAALHSSSKISPSMRRDAHILQLEEACSQALGANVRIVFKSANEDKGQLRISFHNTQALEDIAKRLFHTFG